MISKEILDQVVKRLVKTYHPLAIYLFGSYAWGTPNDDSDLDLLIVVDQTNENVYERPVAGYHALWGLKVANDLLVFTKKEFVNQAQDVTTLCHKVDQEGIKVYGNL